MIASGLLQYFPPVKNKSNTPNATERERMGTHSLEMGWTGAEGVHELVGGAA